MSPKPFDIILFAHDTEPSGAPRVTVDVAQCLRDSRLSPLLVFPAPGGLEAETRASEFRTCVINNPPVAFSTASLPKKASLVFARLGAVINTWRVARQNRHAVCWLGSTTLIEIGIACWLAGSPVVLHVHEDLLPSLTNKLKISVLKRISNHIVFVSPSSQRVFNPLNPQGSSLIFNRISARILETGESLSPSTVKRGEFQILGAGFLSHRKGFDLLIKAFSRIRKHHSDAHLLLAGEDPDPGNKYRHKLEKLVRKLSLENCVTFAGHVDDMASLYRQSDLYVLSSRNEAMPLALVEAMALGCPVVAADVGGVSEIVNEETGYLVKPNSVESLKDGILNSIESGQRKNRARAAKEKVLETFDNERIAGQYLEVYHSVKR